MTRYYTVDRSATLNDDESLLCNSDYSGARLFPIEGIFDREDLENLATELFPDGLSRHGKSYLLDKCLVITTPGGPAPYAPHIPLIELIVELIRRNFFPSRPSRYTSIFAWGSLDDACDFQKSHGGDAIYEIESSAAFKADMNLLYLGGSSIGAVLFAMKYWRGKCTNNPRWEYLRSLVVLCGNVPLIMV